MTLRVFETFAGIGSQRMVLRNLGIPHEVVAISEIDKFAIKSYEAIHGETYNIGDISQMAIENIPERDLFDFPGKKVLNLRLKDILKSKVAEKFYLSKEQMERMHKV